MGLYFLVNPTLFFPAALGNVREIVASWGLVAGGSVLGTLSTWVLLRLLSGLENAPAKLLPGFLLCAAALYGFLAAASTVLDTISAVENVAAGNTDAARVLKSDVLLWTLAVLKLIPSLLGAWVLLWGSELSRMLDSSPFAEETVLLAETVAHRCGIVARASLIVAVGCNLLQLLCSPVVSVIHVSVYLPFGTLALCAILLLLCRYFRRAKAVNDDNNSII